MPADPAQAAAARLRVLAEASVDGRLSALDVRAFILVADRLDAATGLTPMAADRLACELRIAARSAFRVLARIETAGYLVGYRTAGRSTVYSIDWKRFAAAALTSESGDDGVRQHRVGRNAPWAARLRLDPLPFPGLAPAEMNRDQVLIAATYAVAHDLAFKRAISGAGLGRGTNICRLGRNILAGRRAPARRWPQPLSDDYIERLRCLLEHHSASIFRDRAGAA